MVDALEYTITIRKGSLDPEQGTAVLVHKKDLLKSRSFFYLI
ncbi:MAG: hypothetical protein PUB49_11030 [Selenomonadaceae bacterium]|nr:hypothetical protein [Selenomonadaceae bacterium]